MIILGLDPGTATTGFGIIEAADDLLQLLAYGCLKTSNKLSLPARLNEIAEKLKKLLKKWRPEVCAVEKIYFAKNVKTALKVAEARGVIIQTVISTGIPIFEYSPLQIKTATVGYGRAEKSQVQKMVQLLLNLKEIPKPDDAADALAAAICLAHSRKLQEKFAPLFKSQ